MFKKKWGAFLTRLRLSAKTQNIIHGGEIIVFSLKIRNKRSMLAIPIQKLYILNIAESITAYTKNKDVNIILFRMNNKL